MPNSIKLKVEAIGTKNKNDAKLRFRNRVNKVFDWDQEDEDKRGKVDHEEEEANK